MILVVFLSLMILSSDASRTVDQVEHIIIFMQENRAFDHYFGTMQGVRGFNDRLGIPMKSGLSNFHQPAVHTILQSEYMLPYHADSTDSSAMCMHAPIMNYPVDIQIWDHGRQSSWNTARDAETGMAYFTREDLPFYYTLYDNFAVGDQYFQSSLTQTNPNRMFLFSGSNGLSVGQAPVLDNYEPAFGYTWETLADIFEARNISWKVYQEPDDFDNNAFMWFEWFRQYGEGTDMYNKGQKRYPDLVAEFAGDLKNHTLPQVSIVIAPKAQSEHAPAHPAAGMDLTARLLHALKSHPEVYAHSAFILNYDEGGQFYDHHWVPTPPLDSHSSNCSTVTVEGESNNITMIHTEGQSQPIGLGFRVPVVIISPWTRGNIVVSEVFDHTSIIQFLEVRFNFTTNNISPWRRAMTGNLLSFFDFDHPDYSWPELPDTTNYVEVADQQCKLNAPTNPFLSPSAALSYNAPQQEPGVRVSRALGYEIIVRDSVVAIDSTDAENSDVEITFTVQNTGTIGAAFLNYDVINLDTAKPHPYAVESGKNITDSRSSMSSSGGKYNFRMLGANGFVRDFIGDVNAIDSNQNSCIAPQVYVEYDKISTSLVFVMSVDDGSTNSTMSFAIVDNAYNHTIEPVFVDVQTGGNTTYSIDISQSGRWYDFSIFVGDNTTTSQDTSACYLRRFAGRMENGTDSISDPAMGYRQMASDTEDDDGVPPLSSVTMYSKIVMDVTFYCILAAVLVTSLLITWWLRSHNNIHNYQIIKPNNTVSNEVTSMEL